VTRLAHAHGVTVDKLVATEVAPLVNKSAKATRHQFSMGCHNLNGIAEWTALTITALEKLTLRPELAALTLYPWQQVMSPAYLLRRYLAWCPACYTQWRQTNQTIYNPLLWSLKLVHCCPWHHGLLWEHCPYSDCQKRLRLINSRVKLGTCPACKRWLGLGSDTDQTREPAPNERQLWLADQLGQLLTAAPTLDTYPEQYIFAVNLKCYVAATEHGTVQGLAQAIRISPSPFSGWIHRGHRPQLEILAKVCEYLGLSLLEFLTPQPGLDYEQLQQEMLEQQQAKGRVEPASLRRRVEHLLTDPDWSPASAAQVARQLDVTPALLKHHCPVQYQQILQRHEQYQQAQRQVRNEKLAHDLQAVLDSEEIPPPSMTEVGRRLHINPGTARANCPELCRAISNKRKVFYETRTAETEARLNEILVADEQPPPSIGQVAARLELSVNYLYQQFPTICRVVTQRNRHCQPPSSETKASKTIASTSKTKDHAQLRRQFTAMLAAQGTPPPSLAEVSRQLGCGLTLLRKKHPDLCRQLRQQRDAYRQRRRTILEDKLRRMLVTPESPPPSARTFAIRLGIEVMTLKHWLPDLYAEVVRRHQAARQAERDRRQLYLEQVISENPAQTPSLSQVADQLGCGPSTLQRQFPEQSAIIVARYRTSREQERATAQAALEAALTDEQQAPLLPIQVARQLGYDNHNFVIAYFPDLCHQLFQRHEAHRLNTMRTQLAAIVAEPPTEPPLTLETISRQLGYNSTTLKRVCPDLCQVLEERQRTYWNEKKSAVKACLVAILDDTKTPPMSVQAVAREYDFAPDTIKRYFPELTKAVSAKFKGHLRERGQQRRHQLDEEVKRITHQLFQVGVEPKLHRVISRLTSPGVVREPHVRQAWQAARKELGLPT
jgi:AraC-like DNA-binding protein